MTAGLHAIVDRFDEQRLTNNKVKRLEKENAELKAELQLVRSQKEAEDRATEQARSAAEKERILASEAEAYATANVEKIRELSADLFAAKDRAVEDFLSSQDFIDRQLNFA